MMKIVKLGGVSFLRVKHGNDCYNFSVRHITSIDITKDGLKIEYSLSKNWLKIPATDEIKTFLQENGLLTE